ncbi:hypothetical protein HK102_006016 [Quaeritorhiza haematococci]|nr:hypothetical protein HK102_006016 [Quaeritorhiza haematococci]
MELAFNAESAASGIVVGKASGLGLSVGINNVEPLNKFDVTFKKMRQRVEVVPSGGSGAVMRLDVPWSAAGGSLASGGVKFDFEGVDMQVLEESAFADFVKEVTVTSGPVEVLFKGSAEVAARVNQPINFIPGFPFNVGASVCLGDVPFRENVVLNGMGGLKDAKVNGPVKVLAGDTDSLTLSIPIQLNNPSNIKLSAGNIQQTLVYQGQVMGRVFMDNLVLDTGANNIQARAVFKPETPEALAAGMDLLSKFASGSDSAVQVLGSDDSSPIKVLGKALSSLDIPTTLPGNNIPLITRGRVGIPNVFNGKASGSFDVTNPYDVPLTINGFKATMTHNGKQIGSVEASFESGAFTVEPQKETRSPNFSVNVSISLGVFQSLITQGKLFVDIQSTIDAKIGEFPVKLEYSQKQVPSTLGN